MVFPSCQNVVDVADDTWNALQDCVHCMLQQGWCWGYSKWKTGVLVQAFVCVDGNELSTVVIQHGMHVKGQSWNNVDHRLVRQIGPQSWGSGYWSTSKDAFKATRQSP